MLDHAWLGEKAYPTMIILSPVGDIIGRKVGLLSVKDIAAWSSTDKAYSSPYEKSKSPQVTLGVTHTHIGTGKDLTRIFHKTIVVSIQCE